ncbi:hypothetical protein DVDV_3274 [Desulfovibrio sp. DV]|nr:hypothetical protein DVDV_3274 [Desulfovibrio sp. DV]
MIPPDPCTGGNFYSVICEWRPCSPVRRRPPAARASPP